MSGKPYEVGEARSPAAYMMWARGRVILALNIVILMRDRLLARDIKIHPAKVSCVRVGLTSGWVGHATGNRGSNPTVFNLAGKPTPTF
jgi:hypothetical protein